MKLEDITGPQCIRGLSLQELNDLSAAIRETIVNTVSRNGGHLAPSLGVVELAVALHVAYESPEDRIIWDVSHQAYAHKILTGRIDRFHTLRCYGGLSGFCKRSESVHDAFGAGHSSTSISAALGMASAWLRTGEKRHAVAVIGDGALTGGMAFEALNHAGHLGNGLVVVLNDNEMSISPNVGAVSGYLTRIRSSSLYRHIRNDAEYLLSSIPAIGSRMVKATERVRHALKHLLVPGLWFEELGFRYMGPVDGHDLSALIPVLKEARSAGELALVHVVTKKGFGYEPAEKNPSIYHGLGPFDPESGKAGETGQDMHGEESQVTFTECFGRSIVDLARQDPRIVAVCAAMPEGTGLSRFAELFPERFYDVGICEQHATTFAAGMACEGLRPVVAVYSTFLQRAYDQIIHDVCLQNLPVIFAMDRGGLVGEDGPTHHGVFDISSLGTVPNLTFMAPRDASVLEWMLTGALKMDGPVAMRYPRGISPPVDGHTKRSFFNGFKPEILRTGPDGLIVAVGPLVYQALAAAEKLAAEGIADLSVSDPLLIRPLDVKFYVSILAENPSHRHDMDINRVPDEKYLFTFEEGQLRGGFGENLLALLSAHGIRSRSRCFGLPDSFVESGPADILRKHYNLDAEGIYRSAKDMIDKWPRRAQATEHRCSL